MKVLSAIPFLVCMAGVCQAKTEFKSTARDCDGSTVGWWSMSRYDDGRLIETWGVDCNGREYHSSGRAVVISGPLSGSITDTGICGTTSAGGSWHAVVTRDQGGVPVAAWGRDCAGNYWQFVTSPASASQSTTSSAPVVAGERGIR